jgi:hypothetical protein
VEAPGGKKLNVDISVTTWDRSNVKTVFYRFNYCESNAINFIILPRVLVWISPQLWFVEMVEAPRHIFAKNIVSLLPLELD